jgi:tetratricopeptide (TPR) repeat protein
VLGPEHADTLHTITIQCLALSYQGRHKEAVAFGEEGLRGFRRTLGNSNPQTLGAMSRLAKAYEAMGEHSEAEALLRESFDGHNRVLGQRHPSTWRTMERLSNVLIKTDRQNEAKVYLLKVLEQKRRFPPSDIGDVQLTHTVLGHVLRANGDMTAAESTYLEVIAKLQRIGAPDYSSETGPEFYLMSASLNLAGVLRARGEIDEAITFYRDTLAKSSQKPGDEHASTFLTKELLASALRMKGDIGGANSLHEQAMQTQRLAQREPDQDTLAAMRRLMGNTWPDTLVLISDAGARAGALGNLEQAEALLREALAGQRRKLGSNTVDTLLTIDRLREVLVRRGLLNEAEALEKELAKHDWPKQLLRMRDGNQ